jgi:hypothetical protein
MRTVHGSSTDGMITRRVQLLILPAVLAAFLSAPAAAQSYAELRADAVKKCEAVDPSEYQSGLAFNPDGMRSYYLRSGCFQDVAAKFRDESLCAQVKERWSLLWSSWAFSEKQCRKLVAEGEAKDREILDELKARQLAKGVKLRDFTIDRYGNRRDFVVVPVLERGESHNYMLHVEILLPEGGVVPVAAVTRQLWGNENMRIQVRQDDIRQRFFGFRLDYRYRVRATLVLDVGYGSGFGRWSDAEAERIFPTAERSQVVIKELTFRPE